MPLRLFSRSLNSASTTPLKSHPLKLGTTLAQALVTWRDCLARNPDFLGLSVITSSSWGTSGDEPAVAFAKFVAEQQQSVALTVKQERLYTEEGNDAHDNSSGTGRNNNRVEKDRKVLQEEGGMRRHVASNPARTLR